jgi:hypothetical protein
MQAVTMRRVGALLAAYCVLALVVTPILAASRRSLTAAAAETIEGTYAPA